MRLLKLLKRKRIVNKNLICGGFMKVWIDISNAPHVRFFKDVIKYLEAEGEDVIVTARQFGDIHKLLDMYEIDYVSVGKHGVTLYDKLR